MLLKQEMDKACDRKQYRHIIRHLHGLNAYPSGQEVAQTLAAYWQIDHQNRSAKRDEPGLAANDQIVNVIKGKLDWI